MLKVDVCIFLAPSFVTQSNASASSLFAVNHEILLFSSEEGVSSDEEEFLVPEQCQVNQLVLLDLTVDSQNGEINLEGHKSVAQIFSQSRIQHFYC